MTFAWLKVFFGFSSNLLLAQSLVLSSATVAPQGSVTLGFTLSSPAGKEPAALQWTFSYPAASLTSFTVASGPALTNAVKTITCTGSASSYSCLATGLNSTTISNGIVAYASVALAGSTAAAVNVSGALGVSAAGDAIQVSGNGGTVGITLPAVSALGCTPNSLGPAASSNCTVTLSGSAGPGGLAIDLKSDSNAVTVPASVTVASGSTSASFSASAGQFTSDQTATVTASVNSSSKPTTISLIAAVTLSSLQCSVTSLAPNGEYHLHRHFIQSSARGWINNRPEVRFEYCYSAGIGDSRFRVNQRQLQRQRRPIHVGSDGDSNGFCQQFF